MKKALIKKALDLAIKAHKGQKRWGGQPYVTHPEEVGNRFDDHTWLGAAAKMVGYMHDIIEDTDFTVGDIKELGFPEDVVEAVRVITRSKKKSYFDYIRRVQKNDIATLVKIADLSHNLIDVLKFKKSYYRDRNLLARHILLQSHGILFRYVTVPTDDSTMRMHASEKDYQSS